MKKIKQYTIVSRTLYVQLAEDVNKSIRLGFQPYGNTYYDVVYHFQAMALYEE